MTDEIPAGLRDELVGIEEAVAAHDVEHLIRCDELGWTFCVSRTDDQAGRFTLYVFLDHEVQDGLGSREELGRVKRAECAEGYVLNGDFPANGYWFKMVDWRATDPDGRSASASVVCVPGLGTYGVREVPLHEYRITQDNLGPSIERLCRVRERDLRLLASFFLEFEARAAAGNPAVPSAALAAIRRVIPRHLLQQ